MTRALSLFDELMAGVEDMRRHREGKITLRSHEVTERSPLTGSGARDRARHRKIKRRFTW